MTRTEILAQWIKEELHNEYNRMLPERAQKTMSVFELSVYSPTIEETWKKSGIRGLKIDGPLDQKWQEPLEAVVYNAGKYLSSRGSQPGNRGSAMRPGAALPAQRGAACLP